MNKNWVTRLIGKFATEGGEIYISDEGIQIRDENDWPVQHDWFGDRLEDFQRVLQPRVITLEQEAMKSPELREAYEQRGLQVKYWRACSAAFVDYPLALRENDLTKDKLPCSLTRLMMVSDLASNIIPSNQVVLSLYWVFQVPLEEISVASSKNSLKLIFQNWKL